VTPELVPQEPGNEASPTPAGGGASSVKLIASYLDWLEAHEDTASQWTEDTRCHFLLTKNILVEPRPCAEPKQLF